MLSGDELAQRTDLEILLERLALLHARQANKKKPRHGQRVAHASGQKPSTSKQSDATPPAKRARLQSQPENKVIIRSSLGQIDESLQWMNT